MNIIKNVIVFAVGAGVGVLASAKVLEKKYKDIANDEINSIKERYKAKMELISNEDSEKEEENEEIEPTVAEVKKNEDKTDINNYVKYAKKYSTETKEREKAESKVEKCDDEPYVISPEEFGELDGYETIELTYYEGDGFLCDDQDELVDDIEETVGFDSLEKFGTFEDDAVHVRNDARKCDYEILRDLRKYREVVR